MPKGTAEGRVKCRLIISNLVHEEGRREKEEEEREVRTKVFVVKF